MSMPARLRLSRAKGFDLQRASHALNGLPAINVARPGPLGNPFVVGQDGDRATCVDLFEQMLAGRLAVSCKASVLSQLQVIDHIKQHLPDLRGRNVACWCQLDGPCHGDPLLRYLNGPRCEVTP